LIGERASDLSAAIRAAILDEVASIQPVDPLEETHRSDALAWIDSGAPLCRTAKPATPPKHLVSYFAVVDGHYILLVDHRSAQLWIPPGGHVEPAVLTSAHCGLQWRICRYHLDLTGSSVTISLPITSFAWTFRGIGY
jgi:hypothetical protein